MLYLPHLVLDPGQFFPPGPGAGRLQSRLDCLKQLRLHLPIGRQLPHPPLTTKEIYFVQRYYLKRYKYLNTPKNIRVVNRMFYTWTRLNVAVFINGSRSITIITPISWQDFFCPNISPNTTSTCLWAISQYPIIPLTINWMVVKKKQQKWYYTGKNKKLRLFSCTKIYDYLEQVSLLVYANLAYL